MNPEHGVPARDFHVSIFGVGCIVTGSRLLLAVFDPLAGLGCGYSGNAQCGGGETAIVGTSTKVPEEESTSCEW